ncbi:transient receptor potential ion channel protein [Gigaspora margarita]|uniref:Transient receptor potential ion channel protein n=2 Tax=Gigaspora margarita TaxID=4874 RepID=A0A8H4EVT7_GIGMA|nr:transient receptor potential ion channel protein [Gigaspora margarita]
MGHALFIFLGYASYIGLNQSSATYEVSNESKVVYTMTGKPENSFLNSFTAIIAVYNWDSLSLDTWGFWPLIILSVIGNIVFVIILQNVIISFMSAAFENADKDGKRAVLYYQSSLIYEYILLKNSAFISGQTDLDSKFKAKLRMKYICFYDDESVTVAWNYKCKKWKSIPIHSAAVRQRQMKMKMDEFRFVEDGYFIWTANINDDNT